MNIQIISALIILGSCGICAGRNASQDQPSEPSIPAIHYRDTDADQGTPAAVQSSSVWWSSSVTDSMTLLPSVTWFARIGN